MIVTSNASVTGSVTIPLSGTGVAATTAGGTDDEPSAGSGDDTGTDDTTVDTYPTSTTVNVQTGDGRTNITVAGAGAGNIVVISVVALDGLDVTPLVDGDFTFSVGVSETPPPGAPTTPPTAETPLVYLDVAYSIPDADIGDVTFRFCVPKTVLADRGIAPEDVVVYRYHNGA